MKRIKTEKLLAMKKMEETFLETIAITSWRKAFFLGIYPRKEGTINAWLYPGTSMHKLAKNKGIEGEEIYINFTASPMDLLKVYRHEYSDILTCRDDLCFLLSSYLVIPAIIIKQENDENDIIRLTINLDTISYYNPELIPITNRYACMLLEALIHLSRIEYYCSLKAEEQVSRYLEKLWNAIEIMERVSNNEQYREVNKWIRDRAEKCKGKIMLK